MTTTFMTSPKLMFTSESVTEGHPDKMSDQVSDAILDAILAEDPHARVACETLFKTGMVMIFGEISTAATVNYEQVIRDAIKDIGFKFATISGTTVAVADLTIPEERQEILVNARSRVDEIDRQYRRGLLTEEEQYQRTVETWNVKLQEVKEQATVPSSEGLIVGLETSLLFRVEPSEAPTPYVTQALAGAEHPGVGLPRGAGGEQQLVDVPHRRAVVVVLAQPRQARQLQQVADQHVHPIGLGHDVGGQRRHPLAGRAPLDHLRRRPHRGDHPGRLVGIQGKHRAVDVAEPEEPFHAQWEGRMWGIARGMRKPAGWTIDWFRHTVECMPQPCWRWPSNS